MRARPDWAVTKNETFWDNTSLIIIGQEEVENGEEESENPPAQPTTPPSSGVPIGSIPISPPNADGSVVHTVNPGETLIGIAVAYNVDLDALYSLNNLSSDVLQVGQQLTIVPAGGESGGSDSGDDDGDAGTDDSGEEAPPEEESSGEGGGGGDSGDDPDAQPTEVAEAPVETEEESSEAGTGVVCVAAFRDVNGNGTRETAQEPYLPDILFRITQGTETFGEYQTDGISEPHCFGELPIGSGYSVTWAGQDFESTSNQTVVAVEVASDSIETLEFGLQSIGGAEDEMAAGEDAESQTGPLAGLPAVPTWVIAIVAGLGVIFFLSGIGAVVYFVVLRPRMKKI
ncbi:MAG: LysM peptidoglycan-binding domain-containing protein [Chloroflexi bacterium]|nr:LysM peptidoglycan-binding domain-containing protein [Chloroflexota bacterium]